METDLNLHWRVNTPGLLREILKNNGTEILRVPLQVFGDILAKVGERAAELNDPALNALMCRLAIYSVADPESPDYDAGVVHQVLAAAVANAEQVPEPSSCSNVGNADAGSRLRR